MKLLLVPLLWLLALAITVAVLWRMWRGQNAVLRGRWSPRIIRMVAILLVVLGIGVERAPTAPAPAPDPKKTGPDKAGEVLPACLTAPSIRAWLLLQQRDGPWARFKKEFTLATRGPTPTPGALRAWLKTLPAYPDRFVELITADVVALAEGKEPARVSATQLLAALDKLEQAGHFDHWLTGYLWRKLSGGTDGKEAKELMELLGRLERHARLLDTLIKAHAQVRPIMIGPRAWMSKAGPGRELQRLLASATEMLGVCRVLYPTTEAGTWKRDGLLLLTTAKEGPVPTLLREGKPRPIGAGELFRLGRLDLLQTPAGDKPVVLDNAWLGKVTLPADRVVSVWDLPGCLSKEGRKKADKAVSEALDGNTEAADRLEQVLPLAQQAIRIGLKESQKAKGAPRLRLILALFDDAVMPVLPEFANPGNPQLPVGRK